MCCEPTFSFSMIIMITTRWRGESITASGGGGCFHDVSLPPRYLMLAACVGVGGGFVVRIDYIPGVDGAECESCESAGVRRFE